MEYQVEKITKQIKIEKTIAKIFKTIILVFLIMLLLVNLVMLYQKNIKNEEIPRIGSISVFNIVSKSMEPTIKVNDLIIIQKSNIEDLKIGDIITYKTEDGTIVTHRIIKKNKEDGQNVYTTKGDNNDVEDSEKVSFSQVYGKYLFKINSAGKFAEQLQNNGIISVVLIIIIFIILKNSKDKKRETRKHKREKYDIKKKRDEYNKK